MFSAGFFFLSWREIKLQLILKGGKTVRQYIKSHMSGGRKGYVGCRGITEVVKGSIHNWNPCHRRLSGLGDSDTEADSEGDKGEVQKDGSSPHFGPYAISWEEDCISAQSLNPEGCALKPRQNSFSVSENVQL